MTTEQHAWGSVPAVTAHGSHAAPDPVCGCGQDLDVVTGRHCPRCGTTLALHAA